MTVPSNLVSTASSVGQREDLEDVIYRVAPEKTPFVSMIGKGKAKARTHEWQTESLAAADATNAAVEGDDAPTLAANTTTRLKNFCQIFVKAYGVSRTQELVDLAGRSSELVRQRVIKGVEIRRDMEKRFIGNYASNDESGGSTPRRSAGLLAWITTNDSRGSGGSDGGYSGGTVSAATNGTQRTLTEALVKAALATAFNTGADVKVAFMGATHKQQFSAFTGIADIRKEVTGRGQATIIAGADVYVGDFNEIALVPHPYGLTRDIALVDPSMAAVASLDGVKTEALAKTGDSNRELMTMEATLVVRNEAAHAVVADLT